MPPKQKAAHNAAALRRRSGDPDSYAQCSFDELKDRARELGVHGYSGLTRKQLIDRLREH